MLHSGPLLGYFYCAVVIADLPCYRMVIPAWPQATALMTKHEKTFYFVDLAVLLPLNLLPTDGTMLIAKVVDS